MLSKGQSLLYVNKGCPLSGLKTGNLFSILFICILDKGKLINYCTKKCMAITFFGGYIY